MSERTLENPKWERFAQELASGKTADEAYRSAGYKENRGNASTLKAKQIISDRVAVLLERAASRVELTAQTVADNLLRIAGKAEALGEASGRSGKSVLIVRLTAGHAKPSPHFVKC